MIYINMYEYIYLIQLASAFRSLVGAILMITQTSHAYTPG